MIEEVRNRQWGEEIRFAWLVGEHALFATGDAVAHVARFGWFVEGVHALI